MTPPVSAATLEDGRASDSNGHNGERSFSVCTGGSWWRRLRCLLGPGYLVAVGYMDPGNWATDLAGGSAYGYALLWILAVSSAMAVLLQVLAARLGIVAQADLAQLCRRHASPHSAALQWLLCEVAICACDLAEVIGSTIALNMLFAIPLSYGVVLTVFDVLAILWLEKRGFRYLEAFVISLLAVVCFCFGVNLLLAQPEWHAMAAGFLPTRQTVTDPKMLYLAIGIIGATVMPHNLYLHSSTVQTRRVPAGDAAKRAAIGYATVDIVVALCLAALVNAAILITAAAVFHTAGRTDVAELHDAYRLLSPLTGQALAGVLFAVALLAAGLSSSVTATLAGQIVMEGFVRLKVSPSIRRLITRGIAIVPAWFVTLHFGDSGIAKLLILSQVILSLQLPFAMLPLIRFSASKKIMGPFASSPALTCVALLTMALMVGLNGILVWKALG
jgi:manganese transport protein